MTDLKYLTSSIYPLLEYKEQEPYIEVEEM